LLCHRPPAPHVFALALHDALPILSIERSAGSVLRNVRQPLSSSEVMSIGSLFSVMVFVRIPVTGVPPEEVGVNVTFRPTSAGILDRKSTRLNSSHVKISYAAVRSK